MAIVSRKRSRNRAESHISNSIGLCFPSTQRRAQNKRLIFKRTKQQSLMGGWWGQYSFRCQPVDYSNNPTALRVSFVTRNVSLQMDHQKRTSIPTRRTSTNAKFDRSTIFHMRIRTSLYIVVAESVLDLCISFS